MRVDWHGHSAFALTGQRARVFIDPFGDVSRWMDHGMRFEYPEIAADDVDLLVP